MSASLPARPNLDWYRKLAKKKLAILRRDSAFIKLTDAQLVVAREHGFESWRKLVAAINASAATRTADLTQIFNDAAKAIVRRDFESVRSLIQNVPEVVNETGAHPNWRGRPQLLHVAIETGEDAIVKLLLDAGANPSGKNDQYDGWSPVMLAVNWKRDGARDLLIDRGAKIGLYEALMLANDERAILLIEAVDGQPKSPNNGTPLHFARTIVAAKRLLERGFAIDAKDKYGHTALQTAAARGDRKIAEYLLKCGSAASPETLAKLGDLKSIQKSLGKKKPTAALFAPAIQARQIAIVRWLLKQGVDLNEVDEKGISPLHTAAWEGNLPIVKLLVQHGANVHAEDEQYNATPTGWAQHAAKNFNRVACVEVAGYLQKQEEKKWSVEKLPAHRKTHKVTGWKPSMDAAFEGDSARITKLVKAGANPNALSTTPGAHRPLHRAIEPKATSPRGPKHEKAVATLLKLGADPHLRGGYDRLTALQTAAILSPQFVPVLLGHFKPLDFLHACVMLDRARIDSFLKKDKTLASKSDANGYTPLHYVAASQMYESSKAMLDNQLRIAAELIDAGANVNATFPWIGPGSWPISVLYMCCGRNNNAAMTELLMRAGALPFDNESVYHAADEGHEECLAVIEKYAEKTLLADECTKCLRTQMHWGKSRGAKWLLEHGADPNSLHPQFGNSALHQAALLGSNDKIIDLLLRHGGDVNRKNAQGKSAIDLAIAAKKDRVIQRLKSGRS